MSKLLSDYVKVYEGTLTPERCQALIDQFEAAPALHERMQEERSYSFTEINVSRHWPQVEAETMDVMFKYIQQYRLEVGIGPVWPTKVWAEKIRLKRYMPGGRDSFTTHVDVGNSDNSRRFLTAILYLNEPGGGETRFPDLDITVAPAPGRMVIFPPLWLFPHAGLPPLERPKYILHRYLWYPPPDEAG